MDDRFKIYIEQLRDGQIEAISESFDPSFLEIQEKELDFSDPISVKGQAYLAEDNLILHLDIDTLCSVPCSICNKLVKVEIHIKGFYHAVPVNEIKSGVYNFTEILRETILLEIPLLAECNQGNCPNRKDIEKYLKKERDHNDEGYHPFADFKF